MEREPVCYSVKRHQVLERLVASERLHPVGPRKGAMAAAIFQLAAEDISDADKRAAAVLLPEWWSDEGLLRVSAQAVEQNYGVASGASGAAAGASGALLSVWRFRGCVLAGGGDEGEPSWPAARRSPSQLKAAAAAYEQAAKYEAEVEGKSGTCAELSTVYRRLSLRDAPVVDLEVTARVVEKPRTSPTTVCSVEL